VIGGLLTPSDVAVTWAVPTVPGVQTCGRVSESHVPAHMKPFSAMVKTVGLLDRNENVALMVWFCAPLAVAINAKVFPISSDTLDPTAEDVVSETLVGTAFTVATFVALDCPQEERRIRQNNIQKIPTRETNLPMNPSNGK
jgi:hypothetical protein